MTTFATMGVAGAPGTLAARSATEADSANPASPGYARSVNEASALAWAERGVRASLIRLAPSVHGNDDKGLVPQLISAARKRRQALYVDDGANRWCGVHRDDAATLYRLALEQGMAGSVYHAVGDDGEPFRAIADLIGYRLAVPTRSVTLPEAQRQLGLVAPFAATDNPISSERTQRELSWQPARAALLQDIDGDDYFAHRG